MTPTEVRQSLRVFGATEVNIVQKRPNVKIEAEGLDTEARRRAAHSIRNSTPAGTRVVIDNCIVGEPEPSQSRAETVHIENVSTIFDSDETAQRVAQRDTGDVEQVKQRYVSGEIEYVEELESALTEPVEHQLESEGLL